MRSSMRPVFVIGLVVLVVAIVVEISEWRKGNAKEVIPWRSDLTAAQTEGRQTHRLIFAYFTADWCTYCQQMKSTTWADNSVKIALEKYVPVKIDSDAHRELSARYQVNGLPEFLILDEGGNELRREGGMMPAEDMVAWLAK